MLLVPQRQAWVDFFVPSSDPLWCDDVARAALWVGELWSAVVAGFVSDPVSVHASGLVADRWGKLVCFAGAGPGEVFVGGRKVVGVSQRRSRERVRIQTTARVRPEGTDDAAAAGSLDEGGLDEFDLLELPVDTREAGRSVLARRCAAVDAAESDLVESLLRTLQETL